MLTEKHHDLLEKRGIDLELAARMEWTSEASNAGKDVICIPYFRGEKIVGKKFRTISGEKEFYQEKGSEQCLYNLNVLEHVSDTTPIVITEGEMDCMIALQAGQLAMSVPNGAPDKPIESEETTKFDYLKDIPDRMKVIILAVDNDHAGLILLHELAIRLGRYRCKWLPYPKGCKDLNDTWMKFGKKGVTECFKRAEWVNVEGVYRMSQLAPAPDYPALECMVEGMNEHYKLRPGDVTVITGIPSHGKTTFANEIACNMVKFHGWKVAFASFEQSPTTDHLRYLRTYHLGKPAHLVPEGEKLDAADQWVDENFMFIVPPTEESEKYKNQKKVAEDARGLDESITVDWVIEKAATAVTRYGVQLVVIDPYNEMDHERGRGESLTEYTGMAIKKFKRFARKYLVHVIIVAHPAKLDKNKEGEYYIPTLYDISDSSHWYNKTDLGMIIFRNNIMLNIVRVQKCRYQGTIGKVGDVTLKYDDYLGTFRALNADEIYKHTVAFYANHPLMAPPQNMINDVQFYQAERGMKQTEIKSRSRKSSVVKDQSDVIKNKPN